MNVSKRCIYACKSYACILFDIITGNKEMFQTSCGANKCLITCLGCGGLVNAKANHKISNMNQSLMANLATFVISFTS
jgi:hypothetical protein